MISTIYNYQCKFSLVTDMTEFYKEKLEEIPRIRSFINQIKLTFSLPTDRVKLEVAEGERIYKINLITPDTKKLVFGWFVYLPLKGRIDMYIPDQPEIPYIQWKNKKVSDNTAPMLLQKSGALNAFNKLVNAL